MQDCSFLHAGPSQGRPNDPCPPAFMQQRRDVHYNAPEPYGHQPMGYSAASPVQIQTQMQMEIPYQQWQRHQPPHDDLRAALPLPEPRKPITDEQLRRHLAELGAPVGKFQSQEHGVGRPRECELASPKQKDYCAPEVYERARRCYKRYHNAWRKFHSAKSKLAEASSHEKGRLQKLTLKNAELLKSTKEDYLSLNQTGLPSKSDTSPEQREKRLSILRVKLEKSRENITKTRESLSLGEITQKEAAASLQRQNHWKSRTEGEIADIEFGVRQESTPPYDDQLAPDNANTDNLPPAYTGPLGEGRFSPYFRPWPSSASSTYQMEEEPYVPPVSEQHMIHHEAISPNEYQSAPWNENNGNAPPAGKRLSNQHSDSFLAKIDPRLLSGDYSTDVSSPDSLSSSIVVSEPDSAGKMTWYFKA